MRLTLLNKRGISIIEVLLVTAIIGLLMGSIFYLLSVAQSSRAQSTAKSQVQSEVGRAMDWIVNDARQTISSNIGSKDNNPSSMHIKFKKVVDFSIDYSVVPPTGSPVLGNFIEYTYDSNAKTITRIDYSKPGQSWVFNDIMQAPFYTRSNDGSIIVIDPINPGLDSPVLNTRNLVVIITAQKQVNASSNISYTIKEEVLIRN